MNEKKKENETLRRVFSNCRLYAGVLHISEAFVQVRALQVADELTTTNLII